MPRHKNTQAEGCKWEGDCNRCGADDCIATSQQALAFYSAEEERTKGRYSLEALGIRPDDSVAKNRERARQRYRDIRDGKR